MDKSRNEVTIRRHQKKAREQGVSALNITQDNSLVVQTRTPGRTPGNSAKSANGSFVYSDPGSAGTPGRANSAANLLPQLTMRSRQKSPGRNTPTTATYADRFIPTRALMNIGQAHKLLTQKDASSESQNLREAEYSERMEENLNDGNPIETRILSFKSRPPNSNHCKESENKVVYSVNKSNVKSGQMRHIPSVPEKVLDAPELLDDYYLHLMDWSQNNHLAVSLGTSVFMWNAGDGSINSLTQYEEPKYASSINFIKEGNVLACGLNTGDIQLWDVCNGKIIRTMEGDASRISALSWNNHILSSGSQTGRIVHHDVRIPEHATLSFSAHAQEVCGLKWSLDGRLLASGGNDNEVYIWQRGADKALHSLSLHTAAVKALAWCPFQNNVLATGGGTADRTIRIWNGSSGTHLHTIQTGSQVSSLLWSKHYKEFISGHGYADNQLTLWKYPNYTKITDLQAHTGRVLELCPSPDGETVASAAADETLCLWKCWATDKKDTKSRKQDRLQPMSALTRTIR